MGLYADRFDCKENSGPVVVVIHRGPVGVNLDPGQRPRADLEHPEIPHREFQQVAKHHADRSAVSHKEQGLSAAAFQDVLQESAGPFSKTSE